MIFAGDHGVAAHGVSAYPPAITGAMVRTFLAGKAAVNALAATHGVTVRVLDLGVDDDFADLDEDARAALTAHKVRRSSGAIHLEDALTPEQTRQALDAGARPVIVPEDTPWGGRRARVLDPGGYEWSFGDYRPGATGPDSAEPA